MTRARDVANLIGSGNFSSTTFTATAGQTAFTISHTQGFIQVFMNGLLLDETAEYTSNGSAVTLTSGAAAGDEIEVVAYNTFSVGDALNQAAADTRYVNATGDTVTGALTVDTSTSTNLTVDSGVYGGIQFKNNGTDTGYITSFSNGSGAETMYMGGADTVAIHTGTNHALTGGTTRLLIDGSGNVTKPNNPSFHAGISAHDTRASGYYNHSTGSSWVTIHNTGNHFSSGTFTAPVAGVYQFNVTLAAAYSNVHIIYWNVAFQVNGTGYIGQNWNGWPSGMSLYKSINNQCAISLQANDYVRVISECNTSLQTFGHSSGSNSMFSGFLIG